MFLKLEHLVCDSLLDVTYNNEGATNDAVEPITPNPLYQRPLPRLKALVIDDGYWNSHTTLANRLLLDHQAMIAGLQFLDLNFGFTSDTLWWAPVIRAVGATIHFLSISVVDPTPGGTITSVPVGIEQFESVHAYVLDHVAHCTTLQSLAVIYHINPLTRIYAPPPDDLLDALCTLLERRPTPLPALAHLALELSDCASIAEVFSRASCTRLAGSLLDASRYPRFSLLAVRVHPPADFERWSWPGAESLRRECMMRDELYAWACGAFAAFEGVPGVVLEVDSGRFPSESGSDVDGASLSVQTMTSAHEASFCCIPRANVCVLM